MDKGEDRTEEHRQAVTDALTGVLEDGEVFVVARSGDEIVTVVPANPQAGSVPPIMRRDPELYGQLISLNERLDKPAGGFLGIALIGLAIAACIALVAGVHLPLLSEELNAGLANGWAFAGIIVISVLLSWMIKAILRRLAWLGGQGQLARVLRASGLTRGELLAQLRDDDKLERLKTYLGRSGASAAKG